MDVVKNCKECGKSLNYDAFEDCYLCQCGMLFYPKDFGEQDNPRAGIWHIGAVWNARNALDA